ncbi:MAG: T9SS type A sorting domain-containing protein [Bacteroidetes bacterium]|nr:T9SS type A sorting domain-containing protein [Bacteroidota bacterium]
MRKLFFKLFTANTNNFRMSNEITSDTLLCWEDTIKVKGIYQTDTSGQLQYHWNFGNGQISHARNPIVFYSEPGSYLVTLIVSDTLGFADTLQQYIVKLDCNNSSPTKTKSFSDSPHCSIYPNPTNNFVNFVLDSFWEHEVKVSVISLDSKIVFSKTFFDGEQKIIDMNGLDPGAYFIHFQDVEQEETVRVIIIK